MQVLFLNPAALGLLALAFVPLLVHLLVRRPARLTPFPTLRFIEAGDSRAARLWRIADWPLLVVRTALLALAAMAVAEPLVVTPARERAWERRVTRLVVVDASDSMRAAIGAARATAAREARSAYVGRVVEATDLDRALRSAGETLATFPPGRRELVVVSDFQEGAIGPTALRGLDPAVGIRLIATGPIAPGTPSPPAAVPEVLVSGKAAVAARRAREAVAAVNGISSAEQVPRAIVAAHDAPGLDGMRARGTPPNAEWMADVIDTIAGTDALPLEERDPEALAVDGRLLIVTRIDPRAFAFSVLLDAVCRGLFSERAAREAWLPALDRGQLAVMERPARGVPPAALERSTEDDGRWFWLAAAAFLGLETWLRSRARRQERATAHEAQAA